MVVGVGGGGGGGGGGGSVLVFDCNGVDAYVCVNSVIISVPPQKALTKPIELFTSEVRESEELVFDSSLEELDFDALAKSG